MLGAFTMSVKFFVLVAVQEPTVAVAVTKYSPALIAEILFIWIFCSVELNPLGPDHVYDTVPLGVPVGVALILNAEPLQTTCLDISASVTAGAFTVMVISFVAVAVQEPSVAVAVTV